MSRPMSPEFIKAWKAYEAASAKAADMYEALPLSGRGGRILKCACGTIALDLCRACRREMS